MNLDQILSFVRAILNLAGGTLVAKGYSDSSQWEAIAGGVMAIVAIAWSFWHHKTTPDVPTGIPPVPPPPKT